MCIAMNLDTHYATLLAPERHRHCQLLLNLLFCYVAIIWVLNLVSAHLTDPADGLPLIARAPIRAIRGPL